MISIDIIIHNIEFYQIIRQRYYSRNVKIVIINYINNYVNY